MCSRRITSLSAGIRSGSASLRRTMAGSSASSRPNRTGSTCSRFDGIGCSCYPLGMSDPPRSPRILERRWGLVRIDGHGTVKDAKLFPGGARAWDWRETGTRHRPGIQPADVAELLDHGATGEGARKERT
jgi:hypothetical protein